MASPVTLQRSGEHSAQAGNHAPPETLLAAEVLFRAFADGCAPPAGQPVGKGGRDGTSASPHDRTEAWTFLTAARGSWAASRREWASAAGIEEQALRAVALRRGKHPLIVQHEEKQREQHLGVLS